ncbi:hypothetical protein SAMN04488115_102437 [Bosea lathyri]|uniref:Uncharacterized protein n=1 Tax=Bosea lathyri TaxID=1036778 RepID=A0A1H5VU15_9HYPH|nr:hypothetical protein SAMN04488115_102437 [Bosea lathyri]
MAAALGRKPAVIPGLRGAKSPEPMRFVTGATLSERSLESLSGSGFRAQACGLPRNDGAVPFKNGRP